MTLYLKEENFDDEGDLFIMVTPRIENGDNETLPARYSFSDPTTQPTMETKIVADLGDKGYTSLSPVIWE